MERTTLSDIFGKALLRAALPAAIAVIAASLAPSPAICGDDPHAVTASSVTYQDPACNSEVKSLQNEIAVLKAAVEQCVSSRRTAAAPRSANNRDYLNKAKECAGNAAKLNSKAAELVQVMIKCNSAETTGSAAAPRDRSGMAGDRVITLPAAGKPSNLKAGDLSQTGGLDSGVKPLIAPPLPVPAAAPAAENTASGDTGRAAARTASGSPAPGLSGMPGKAAEPAAAAAGAAGRTPAPATAVSPQTAAAQVPRPAIYWAGGTSSIFDFFGTAVIRPKSVVYDITPQLTFVPIDTAIWDFINIDYPASVFPMAASIEEGKRMVIKAIRSRPGGFALAGTSQGAIVMSEVYKEILNGSLRSRKKDLLAGCMFGNPSREEKALFPGCPDPGVWDDPRSRAIGHGILPAARRLKGTEPLWWEFSNVGDPVCTMGDDGVSANLQVFADLFIMGRIDGRSLMNAVRKFTAFPKAVAKMMDVVKIITTKNSAHSGHAVLPAYPGASETASQIAVRYLNSVGQTYNKRARQAALDSQPQPASPSPASR